MTARKKAPPISDAEEARIQAGIAKDPDNPELTEENFRQARPFGEVFPDLAKSIRRGRPRLEHPKVQVTVRLDADIVDALKAGGPGWQTRLNETLRRGIGKRRSA